MTTTYIGQQRLQAIFIMTDKKKCPGPGRPRGFDPDAAVEIATKLFHERGYDGVGVAELCEAIGVKPPSLYAAFGSKLGLFERAVALYLAEGGRFMAEALSAETGLAETLRGLLLRAAETYTAGDCPPGCLVMDGASRSADPEARDLTAALKRQARSMIRDRIRRDCPREAGALADYVMVALYGLSAAARDGMSRKALRGVAAGFATELTRRLDAAD